ncbi:MAG TPA: prolyl oligopeptidase family serine peptidase [Acidimicrobiales bacterium]|nr:prolyl oligopeptidase family serine peptidase [Acidimicrobiales bacterium]
MTRTVAPYGTWPSPITPDLLTEGAVRLSDVGLAGGRVAWNEGRPSEGGRQVLVADGAGDLVPAALSVRTRVHEYGGRCWVEVGDALVVTNDADQRLWVVRSPGAEPEPLTPEGPRYADPVADPAGRFVIAVREAHGDDGTVENDLAVVTLDGTVGTLVGGRDFYAAPAISPDGRRVAWVDWDHPNMPWDDTDCWVGELVDQADGTVGCREVRHVAGGDDESVQQPRWSPDGVLHWISDRSGWWNLYRSPTGEVGDGGEALCPMAAEFGQPGWVFGTSTYCFTADGRLVATWGGPDGGGTGVVAGGAVAPFDLPWSSYDSLVADGTAVACIAASPTTPAAVVRIDADGAATVLRASRSVDLDPAGLSVPARRRFPTAGGEEAWAVVYPPASATHEGPAGERPPLVVMSHGGPTSSARSALDLGVQFWTSRGFAVADVDYRGSTGYGRAYRNRLRGAWGVCDVEDCAGVATWLASVGEVDGDRCVIRGGSAGGFTTLACLAFTDVFAAGADLYGVADLEALARDTHKFESRYLDRMVGPWPEAAATYRERSPIHHLEGFDRPLIIFQGLEDLVVPPAQSEMIFDALKAKGVPVAYLPFPGEQHGFRRAETIRTVAAMELSFYGLVLGFTPDGAVAVPVVRP